MAIVNVQCVRSFGVGDVIGAMKKGRTDMGDGIFKDELSRRDAMKTALKAGAYAAPVILAASVPGIGVAAATPGPGGPTITGVNPSGGPTTGGTVVTLTGTNFCPGATVTVNGVAATGVTQSGTTTITFTTPAGTAGAATITVTCPLGQATGGFTYRVCTVSGEAFGLNAVVTGILALSKVADVVLPPGGTQTVATAGVAGILTTGVITDTTADISTPATGQEIATSSSTVNTLSLLGGAITATLVRSVATSTSNGTTATSSSAGTTFTNLVIAGNPVAANPAANTVIAIPGVGSVIVNEQIPTGNGTMTTGLTVNALHVTVTTAGLLPVGADIVVASARSGASCV